MTRTTKNATTSVSKTVRRSARTTVNETVERNTLRILARDHHSCDNGTKKTSVSTTVIGNVTVNKYL